MTQLHRPPALGTLIARATNVSAPALIPLPAPLPLVDTSFSARVTGGNALYAEQRLPLGLPFLRPDVLVPSL